MHYSSSQGDVVGWNTSANASWWTITDMNYTDEQIQAAWDLVDSFVLSDELVESYQTVLDKIFNDKACTTPKLATFAQAQAVDGYSGLPAALKDLVEKVYNNKTWEETNSDNQAVWSNDYARRFRVQMYEPYSIAGDITNFLGMNAHNNMDNPTGIYANAQEAMYIMVEEEPAEGSELYVGYITGHGQLSGYKSYTKLKKGLNAVPYFADGSQLWIMYLVDTYNPDGATDAEKFPHKLSSYKPIKINIAGGHINGYYNAIGDYLAEKTGTEDLWGEVDNDNDWAYYSPRVALTSSDFTLLGHRQTLQFLYDNVSTGDEGIAYYLNDSSSDGDNENINVPSKPYSNSGEWSDYTDMNLDPTTGEINIMLEAWDRIMYSEHATLGLVSNSTMKKINEMYPRWNADGTKGDVYTYDKSGPDGKTYKEFCGVDYSEYFNHHGVALGGDWSNLYMSAGGSACNYHYNTLGSIITEIATSPGSLWGPAHEIGHQHQAVFNIRGGTEVTNNVFSNAAVWYMGMATSRVNGNEGSLEQVLKEYYAGKPFIDYNIWSMTQMFYKLWLYYHLAGNNTQFYPRFFEMLRRDPLQANGSTATGSQSMLKIYEKMCDAAGEDLTEFFRIHGFFVLLDNYAKEDYGTTVFTQTQEEVNAAIARVQEKYGKEKNYAVIFINDATENTGVQHDGKTPRALWDKNASAEYGSYIDIVNGEDDVETPYTAVLNADNTITMTGGKGGLGFIVIDNETDKVLAFSNKSTFALSDEVSYLLATNKITISTVNGRSELTRAEVDFNAMQKKLLEALVADVEAMPIDDGTYTHVGFYKEAFATDILTALEKAKSVLEAGKGGYAAAYEILYSEYTNPDSKITLDLNKKYIISNKEYPTRNLAVNGATVFALENNTTAAAQWSFVETGTAGSYYLKNDDGYYCPAVVTGGIGGNATTEQTSAGVYTLKELEHGLWAIVGEKAPMHASASQSYNIVGWSYDATASQWYITASETDEKAAEVNELQALIAKTETLMNEVATVSLKGKVQLQADNANSAFFITSNATEAGHEPKYLLDDNVSTFFHTVWTGTSPGADHYLQIDLGEEYPVDQFTFKYTNLPTTSWNVDAATEIKVQGANTLDEFTDITTLTDLPTAKEGTYTSATLGAKGTNYRYIRLTVTNATGDKFDNHYYFGMSEFSLERLNSYSKVNDAYKDVVNQSTVATVADKLVDARTAITNGSGIAEAKEALQAAYNALLLEYNGVANAKKKELQDLIDETNNLIASVGEAVATDDANVNLLGKLYAERVYTAGGTSHSDYSSAENGYNLLDGNVNTHFHSDYNFSTMVSPPYLRVDLGKGNSARKVNFNYTTRNADGCAPKIINVYGGVAGVEYSQGAIQSSAALNAVTTPTKIVIKNLSNTNSKYFAGASNETDINAAVLVWEPVEDGVAGKYYLRTTDAVSGYIQKGNTTVGLGPKDNAQVFVTTSPSTTGADATYFDVESLDNADLDNLVRFVQEGGSTWLNVQHGDTGTPRLGHTGKGGWTVHNVYLVTATENDTPSYDATPIATFKSTDASNPLPTGTSVKWTSADIASTKDYRFFKFEVAESQGSKTENGNKKYYFAISEFGFNKVGEVSAIIKAEYQGLVSEELLIETRRAVNSSETMLAYSNDIEMLKAQITQLQAAKTVLEEAKAKKARADLAELIQATQELCDEMSTPEGAVAEYYLSSSLTADNLAAVAAEIADADAVCKNLSATYADIKAAYTELEAEYNLLKNIKDADVVDREQLAGLIATMEELLAETTNTIAQGTLALQCTDEKAPLYIKLSRVGDGSVANMIDKNDDGTANTGTYVGTAWGDGIADYTHYVQVYLGEKNILGDLTFGYATRKSDHSTERPEAIKVLGSDDGEHYTEIALIDEGLATGAGEQWTLQTPLAVYAKYSYIRFAVKSGVNSFHMSDFNLYTNGLTSVNNNYSPSDIANYLPAALREYNNSKNVAATYITTDSYSALVESLQAQIDALQGVIDANVDDRTELTGLIENTKYLVTEVAVVDETESKIALQCTDENASYYLYCNAPGKTNNYDGDDKGVTALLDNDSDTFLHTTYNGNDYADDLDHYLRLDMGENEALAAFKFNYVGRVGNTDNAPKTIVIEGSNDRENFEEITTLKNLPTADNATYQSDVITNGKAYRYIRFMVTETSNGSDHNGHDFFALSHFSVTACKTIKVAEDYVSPNLPLSTVVAANNEVVDGITVKEQFYVTQDLYDSTVAELQAAKDALEAAIALKNIPVKLTTDVNNPVLYKIRINRSYAEYASLQYDASDSKVAIAAMEFATANAQSWYFMQGTDADSYEDILILPYVGSENPNTTLRLAAEDTNSGAGKVMAVEANNATYTKQNWYITVDAGKTAEGWWNIRPEGKNNYFSNHSGNGNKMGFWNSSSDDGSEFKFILDEAYAIVEEAFASYTREPEYTDVPGYLATDDYNNAYDAVAGYIENKNGEDADVFDAFAALEDVKANATYVPSHSLEHGAVYRIMNLITNTETQYKYHYIANNNAAISFPTEPKTDGSDLWVCIKDGDNYKFVSALGTLSLGWRAGSEDAQTFVVSDGIVDGAKCLKKNSDNWRMALTNEKYSNKGPLFNQSSSSETQSDNWSTDWFFQNVDAEVAFNVSISSRRFSSLYLPYNVTVPEGVSAFTAVAVDGGYVDLYRVADNDDETAAGNTIPARTPVILYIEDDNEVPASSKAFAFEFTAGDASLDKAIQQHIGDAIIYGKILQTPVECTDGYRYYKLGSKNGDTVSKMYWMYKEYSRDGTIANGNAGTDNGGYIRCSANKIYMRVQENNAQNAFSMRFAGATTGIDEVNGENGEVKAIYDMQGRKLTEITMPGMYIVNGKKVMVK